MTYSQLTDMALTAACDSDKALMFIDRRDGNGREVVFASGMSPIVCVAHDQPVKALDTWGDAIDALRNTDTHSDADTPVAVGCLSYDAAWEAVSPRSITDGRTYSDQCPSAWLARYNHVQHVALPASWDEPTVRTASPTRSIRWNDGAQQQHMNRVNAIRESIRDGEVYLVNLARTVHAQRPETDAVAMRVLDSRARYGAIFHAGESLIAGMSMELALALNRTTQSACTRPIKGTRPRQDNPHNDAMEAMALALDPKERAENTMAVDVHRNDLGRVAETGSVVVPVLCDAEPHRFVHHLVSTVEARISPHTPMRDILRAMFPVGSVTGAPKIAAMNHIARFEDQRRGLYTGTYGVIYGDGSVQLAVAIRTMVVGKNSLSYGVGGGIVWDSDPEREWNELDWKCRAAVGVL
jgi:para-aminobenzoate synthetase component I